MGLSKSDIFARNTLPREEVPMPEWGGSVWVRTLTASAAMKTLNRVKADTDRAFCYWLCDTVCDADGAPLFDESDIERLSEQPIIVVQRLVDVALRLNVGKADDAAKN